MSEIIEGEAREVPKGAEDPLAEALGQIDGPEQAEQTEGAQAEQPQGLDQQEEMAVIIFTAGQVLAMKYPSLAAVFTIEKCRTVAAQVNPLFVYYGWKLSLGGLVGLWLNSMTAIVMLGMEIKEAVARDVAEALKQAAEKQP
jgi:hypothetical protein